MFLSAKLFATDHRLAVGTLKLHVKSGKPPRCDHSVFHQEKLKDLACAHGYALTVSNLSLTTLENTAELWDTFTSETLEATKDCVGSTQGHGVASSRKKRWIVLRRVVLPDLLRTATSTGLCHVGLELS